MGKTKQLLLGAAGALVGAVLGHLAFVWAAKQGFYALMLPGALAGVGGAFRARERSLSRAGICSAIGLAAGIVSEWRSAPFIADPSFPYFITHLHQLRPLTVMMILGGAAFGYWLSIGRGGSDLTANER